MVKNTGAHGEKPCGRIDVVIDRLRDRHTPPEGELGGGPPVRDLLERDLRSRF